MRRIGILQCDSVRPEFKPEHGDYPAMFERLFRFAADQVVFSVYDVEHGDYPPNAQACDAYLITGSRASVFEPLPWIAPLLEYLRELHRRRLPVVCVCFGHQALAQALGGRVERSDKGWGVGVREVEILAPAQWMQPPAQRLALVYSHQDQVTRLPPDAVVVAGDEFCPNAIFSLDRTVLGVQGHPEFTPAYAECLLDLRRQQIGPTRVAQARESLKAARHDALVATWMLRFLGVVPAARGA